MKKFLFAITFMALVLNLSGCTSNTSSEKVDYIVSEAPAVAREGIKDPTTGFVKINPNFRDEDMPKATEGAPVWFKNGLGSKIPAIDNGNILEAVNNDKQFLAYVGNIDEKKFDKYIEKLLSQGFQYGESKSWESLSLSSDTYEVNLRFCQDGSSVATIRAKVK